MLQFDRRANQSILQLDNEPELSIADSQRGAAEFYSS